jgi:hypothetical protein
MPRYTIVDEKINPIMEWEKYKWTSLQLTPIPYILENGTFIVIIHLNAKTVNK